MQSPITIANYEEFFLLYVDNELSAEARKAVEEFVLAHPGLAVELEMLQQVQLVDEPLVFSDRNTLYRKESEEITMANCEEQFLLFVDEELTREAREKVERFVLQHPGVQEGFTLLKQTRLEAETIVFPDKTLLYRNEEKERPVFYMRWQRIAVAAAFIGLAVGVWSVLPGNKASLSNPAAGIAQAEATKERGVQPGQPVIDPSNNKKEANSGLASVNAVSPGVETLKYGNAAESKGIITVPTGINAEKSIPVSQPAVNEKNEIVAAAELQKPVETIRGETVSTDNHNGYQTAVANTQRVTAEHSMLENHAIAANTEAVTGGPNNNESQPAVYRELDTEDEKKSLLLGSLEINKDKLRGFFRKAGSIFRSKSKTEDEKTESRPSSNTRAIR